MQASISIVGLSFKLLDKLDNCFCIRDTEFCSCKAKREFRETGSEENKAEFVGVYIHTLLSPILIAN